MPRKPSPRRMRLEARRPAASGPLTSPTGKDIVCPSVVANAATKAKYQAKMEALIDDMNASLQRWIVAAYRSDGPLIAQDAAAMVPARKLDSLFKRLAKYWQDRFDDAAPKMATYFATAVQDRSQDRLKTILKNAGFTVKFDPTPTTTDIFQATLAENVGLIRSIASEHLTDVQGIVMRGVQAGRDAHVISRELQERYGVTRRRADTIARDQNNKATSAIARARTEELGLFEKEWKHSHAGKHPRPDHVAADGRRYDSREGCLISGRKIQPGEEINCRCTAKTIIPGF